MAQYTLDTVAQSFSLSLRGKDGAVLEFDIKYPNTEEMRAIVKSATDLEDLIKSDAEAEVVKAKSKESEKQLNALISPVGHEFTFSDVFSTQPINVQREFRKIIQKEFGGSQD